MLAYSESATRNFEAIYQQLQPHFNQAKSVLEIGCGTGQHAVEMCQRLAHIYWQPSDREQMLDISRERFQQANLANLADVVALDVDKQNQSLIGFDWVYSCNTLHIMPDRSIKNFFQQASLSVNKLNMKGGVAIYGPFLYASGRNNDSNLRFDAMLKSHHPFQGVRYLDDVMLVAKSAGFELQEDLLMPANNSLLIFRAQ